MIGKYLDKISTNIDLLLHKAELQIEKLREYRQSLIFATVTGKIDARQQQSEAAISE